MRFIGNHDDVATLGEHGCASPCSSGRNFWIVVKTTPPAATCKLPAGVRGSRPAPGLPQQILTARERAEELVVKVVAIGEDDERRILHRRLVDDAPGVERHRQALARALRVPDDADAPVARIASAAGRSRNRPRPRPRPGLTPSAAARNVSRTASWTAWNWW